MKLRSLLLLVPALAICGCANYRWTSRVPEEIRTVAVPVFQNRSEAAELGSEATTSILREIQREGTFSVRRSGDASIEIQGAIVKATLHPLAFDRAYGMRAKEYRYHVTAEVSLVNKDQGKVLVQNKKYVGETTFLVQGDLLTGRRNASTRIAADLARQIVDDLVSFPYNKK